MRKITLWIFYLSLAFTVSVDVQGAILQTAQYNGHTYHLLDLTTSWADSEAQAVSLGGHLVTINDSAENDWILNTFGQTVLGDLGVTGGAPAIWTGLVRDPQNLAGGWFWVSGEPVTYTNWAPGEPRNLPAEITAGMLVRPFEPDWLPGQWHDINVPISPNWDYDYGLVEIVPEPSTALLLGLGLVGMVARRRV